MKVSYDKDCDLSIIQGKKSQSSVTAPRAMLTRAI